MCCAFCARVPDANRRDMSDAEATVVKRNILLISAALSFGYFGLLGYIIFAENVPPIFSSGLLPASSSLLVQSLAGSLQSGMLSPRASPEDVTAYARQYDGRGCRLVYQDCPTGIGDKLLDSIAGAALSHIDGCPRPLVLMRPAHTSGSRAFDAGRLYSTAFDMAMDSSRRSAFRTLALELHNRTFPHYPAKWIFLGRPCGVHTPDWLSNQSSQQPFGRRAQLHRTLRQMARSVRIRECDKVASTVPGIGKRVGIHIRRGDKLRAWRGASREPAKDLELLYSAVGPWLRQHGHRRAFLAGDDRRFLERFARRLSNMGIDALAAPSNASSALDDMCRLSRTSMVVQASLQSHFASVAAIIGPGKMVVFEGASNEATRPHTRGWEEAGALEVVSAPLK